MAVKKSGSFGTVAYILFTSIVGPILVQVIVGVFRNESSVRQPARVTTTISHYPPSLPESEEPVTAQGVGATPEAAWDDAVLNGLRMAVLERMDSDARSRDGAAVWAVILEDCRGLITRCVDMECSGSEGFWRRQVAVFVNRAEVANRLRTAQARARAKTL